MLLVSAMTVSAEKVQTAVDDLKYEIDTETKEAKLIQGLYSDIVSVNIPSSITVEGESYSVTELGEGCFSEFPFLNQVIIPNTVRKLEAYSFFRCPNLVDITISSSVKELGEGCFAVCPIWNIELPPSLEIIGEQCFSGCGYLQSIYIPASVKNIGLACFAGCSNLYSVIVSNSNTVYDSRNDCNAIIETNSNALISGCKSTVIPNTVTSIYHSAFAYIYSLKEIQIPTSITSIGMEAFKGTGLQTIFIPKSITELSSLSPSFADCQDLESIIVDEDNPRYCDIDGVLIDKENNCLMTYPAGKRDKEYTIPNTITSIGNNAFIKNRYLTSITLGESIEYLGVSVFSEGPIMKLICLAKQCPYAVFGIDTSIYNNATLYVPKESIDLYKSTIPWSYFKSIVDIESTDINHITHTDDNEIKAVFGVDGKRIDGMKKGMNIVKMNDGETRKVIK